MKFLTTLTIIGLVTLSACDLMESKPVEQSKFLSFNQVLCDLFIKSNEVNGAEVGCTTNFSPDSITLKSLDGSLSVNVPILIPGQEYKPTEKDIIGGAQWNDTFKAWTNFTGVFAVEGASEELCLFTKSYAPDGRSNSYFIFRNAADEPETLSISPSEEELVETKFKPAISLNGERTVFAIVKREKASLHSVTVRECN